MKKSAYPNATTANLKQMLAKAQRDLQEYQDWKKNRPDGVWMHRSSGTWAKNEIRSLEVELRKRTENHT